MKKQLALSIFILLFVSTSFAQGGGQNNGQGIIHWKLDGNSASENHFIGTINEKPLVFKANGLEGIRLLTDGGIRLEQLKLQPNENTFGLPRVLVINDDGTLKILTGQELANNILFGVPNATLQCTKDETGTEVYSASWVPKTGNPALLYADHKCGQVNVGINTSSPTHAFEVVGNSFFNDPVKFYTNLSSTYKALNVTTSNGIDVFRIMGDGKVWATEVNIRVKEKFPDYVFDSNYKLMSLKDLEAYIEKEKHLPNIPAASEVEVDGVDLGEMNRLLLEKVEELTLYILQQQKQIESQQKQMQEVKQELNELKEEKK